MWACKSSTQSNGVRELLSRFFSIGFIATRAGWSHSEILFHERFKSAPISVDLQQENRHILSLVCFSFIPRLTEDSLFTCNCQEKRRQGLASALSWKRRNSSTLGRWGGNWPESPLVLGKRRKRVTRLGVSWQERRPPFSRDLERLPDSKL